MRKTTLTVMALAMLTASVNAGDANWSMGTPNNNWSMGTPDGNYPMDGRQAAIAEGKIRIGFTADEVFRALGYPDSIQTLMTEHGRGDVWYYGNLSVTFINGVVTRWFNEIK
jgi:hypothetical protein